MQLVYYQLKMGGGKGEDEEEGDNKEGKAERQKENVREGEERGLERREGPPPEMKQNGAQRETTQAREGEQKERN